MCADSWVYCRGRAGLSSPGGATQHIATPLNHTHFFLFHCKIHHFFNKFTKWCVFIFFLAKQNKKGVYILSKYTLWYNTAIKRGKKIPWNWPACLFSVFVSLHKSSDVFLPRLKRPQHVTGLSIFIIGRILGIPGFWVKAELVVEIFQSQSIPAFQPNNHLGHVNNLCSYCDIFTGNPPTPTGIVVLHWTIEFQKLSSKHNIKCSCGDDQEPDKYQDYAKIAYYYYQVSRDFVGGFFLKKLQRRTEVI